MNLDPDLDQAAALLKANAALYIGGMGSREKNFYNEHARRLGYEDAAREIQDLFLGGDRQGAMAAVPTSFVDDTSLLGPVDRLVDRISAYAEAGVTTLSIAPAVFELEGRLEIIRAVAEAHDRAGVGR